MTTRFRCFRRKSARLIIRSVPRALVTDTFQVVLATALIGVGLISFYALATGNSGQISKTLTTALLRGLWGGSFVLGGVFQLLGIQKRWDSLERYGCHLAGIGSLAYALTAFSVGSAPSVMIGFVFMLFTLAYATHVFLPRLMIWAAGPPKPRPPGDQ